MISELVMPPLNLEPIPARPRLALYQREARALAQAFRNGDAEAVGWFRRYHPGLPGRPNTNDRNRTTADQLLALKVSAADAQCIVARAHHFSTWRQFTRHLAVLNHPGSAVAQFERAVTAIVAGDAPTLRRQLQTSPWLAHARSDRDHRATLLHYVSANAVEPYHQKTPKNAVMIAKTLLLAGASVDADLDYGEQADTYPERRGSTTLGLVATSCHPASAGVQISLLDLLIDHGASVDGLVGGWNPLIAALHNGRGPAASHLAKRGAAMNLEGASGAGCLETVKRFIGQNGRLLRKATRGQRDHGFLWACQYGHRHIIDFLLENGADVDTRAHGETGLHWAAFKGHASIVAALLQRKASPNLKDRHFGGTPLGWALYGWTEGADADADHYQTVACLTAAGGMEQRAWLAHPHRGHPILEKIGGDPRMRAALGNVALTELTALSTSTTQHAGASRPNRHRKEKAHQSDPPSTQSRGC